MYFIDIYMKYFKFLLYIFMYNADINKQEDSKCHNTSYFLLKLETYH